MTRISLFPGGKGRVAEWKSTCSACQDWSVAYRSKIQAQRKAEEHAGNTHGWDAVIVTKRREKK